MPQFLDEYLSIYIFAYVDLNLLVGVMTFTFCPLHCFYATIVEGGAADKRRRPILVLATNGLLGSYFPLQDRNKVFVF